MIEQAPTTHVPEPLLPTFEGKPVDASALKLAAPPILELDDNYFGMDDIVQIVVEARVNGVDHRVHEASGKLLRVHTAKALSARLLPYSAHDRGVV